MTYEYYSQHNCGLLNGKDSCSICDEWLSQAPKLDKNGVDIEINPEEEKQVSKDFIEHCYELGLDTLADDFAKFDIERGTLTQQEVDEINKELSQDEVGEWISWVMNDEVLKERYTPEQLQQMFSGKRKSQKSRFLYLITNKQRVKLNQFLNEL